MRTVIFIGLLSIADAIELNIHKELADFYMLVFVVVASMDIIEMVYKMKKK